MAGLRPRILQGATFDLSYAPRGADGEPSGTDPGVVTVAVTRSDGTSVVAAGTATTGTGTAPRTYTLTAVHTALLDWLTVLWSVSGTVVARASVEVVGDFYYTSAELRTTEPSTADPTRPSTLPAAVLARRLEVETMFESACGVAFVPRFAVERFDDLASCHFALSWAKVRAVRWARTTSGTTITDFTADQLSYVTTNGSVATLPYLSGQSVEVGYEHGYWYGEIPADIRREALEMARVQGNKPIGGVPANATSMQLPGGTAVTLGPVPRSVAEVLERYDHRAMLA